MNRKRLSVMLAGLIICILGIYVTAAGSSRIWREMKASLVQEIQDGAEKLYLPGMTYRESTEEKVPAKEWLTKMAMNIIPLGSYVEQKKSGALAVEDEATYEMLAKMQAEDENEVDESGKLIGEDTSAETKPEPVKAELSMEKLKDFEYLTGHFYTVDSVTYVNPEDLNAEKLMAKDMRISTKKNGPKVLIFHTHSQEKFKDSGKGADTGIVGVGQILTDLLNDKYGIPTMHHEGVYDLIGGKLDRSEAYERARPEIEKILRENPSIEVVIDLHRDGVRESTHLVTEVNGKQTAQIMFFNGMCRTRANGDLSGMLNPYIKDNLAFSMQMKIAAEQKYPGFTRRNYLKGYKYNMDLMPKMLLVEAGAQTNTVEEMRNAMEPLADLLHEVLTGAEK